MIRSIRIQRYKSIVDVTLELGSVNIFHGGTCAGKSNILEAFVLLGAAVSGRVDRGLHGRGVRAHTTHACALRSVPRGPIEIEAASDRVSYCVKLDESDLSYLAEVVKVDGSAVAAREHRTGWADISGQRLPVSALPSEGIAPIAAKGRRFLLALEEVSIFTPMDVVEFDARNDHPWGPALAELSNLGLTGMRRIPMRHWNLRAEGSGALSMLGTFLLLLSRWAPLILAVDGPDPTLSPELASAFAARVRELAIERERQLLWITNSPESLGTLRSDVRVRLFGVRRDPQGATTVDVEE